MTIGPTPAQLETVSGFLEIDNRDFGFLRSVKDGLERKPTDVFVGSNWIRKFNLRSGLVLEGEAGRSRGKSPEIKAIHLVNGMRPEQWTGIPEFTKLTVVSPMERLSLERKGPPMYGDSSLRVIDLLCPLGKGQRCIIVSPPKAGKTMLIQHIAHAISEMHKRIDLVVLLIDERPEEVTEMRRTIRGQVFASSSDSERGRHVHLAQLVLEYARRRVEMGRDVVLLLDSLTRLGRAFNLHQRSSGRTLSGGVDARALEIPKRIFGAARTIEGGGSLTIIATALIDTGSRMDDLVFQEFKGTGNMELVLNSSLANERIFPSIDINLSGTRREELLFGSDASQHQALRRSLARKSPRDAMLAMLKLLQQFPTNVSLLEKFDA